MKQLKLRGVIAAVSGALLLGAMPAMADSTDDIINALISKGVLTEEEGALLMKGRAGEKEAAEKKKESEVKASFKDGISFKSGDGQHKVSFNGRIQLDYRDYGNDDAQNADTFDIRRAYMTMKGTFYDTYDFEVTANHGEVKGESGKATSLLYAWMNVRYWEQAQLKFGQFKAPMGLEELTSSRFINFQERSMAMSLVPGVDRGIELHGKPVKGLTYALHVGNGASQNTTESSKTEDSKDVTGRVTANIAEMIGNKEAVMHVGGSYSTGEIKGDKAGYKVSIGTEGRGEKVFEVDYNTPEIDRDRYGIELAGAYGPFKLQGEYVNMQLDNNSGVGSDEFDSWYVAATWLITGENYADSYKGGKFDRITPKNNFTKGGNGWGAWELGLRYSEFEADLDPTFTGRGAVGSSDATDVDAWTLGLKWIPHPNTRFLLNYVKTDFNDTVITAGEDDEKALTFRAQFDF